METTGKDKAMEFFKSFGTPIAVLVGALIIGAALAFGQGGAPREEAVPEPVPVDIKDVSLEGNPFVGSASAPVTMAVWFDYQCHFCKQYETTTLEEVMSTYGDQVRIVYKDFQFFGEDSNNAAIYSRAVWEAAPTRWGEWFAGMFAAGPDSQGTLSIAEMDALSSSLGLDVARITQLRTDKEVEYLAAIDADREEGTTYGITGTPGTIIGTTLVPGAQTFDQIKLLLDAELAK